LSASIAIEIEGEVELRRALLYQLRRTPTLSAWLSLPEPISPS
jgi:hypothetical protein